ncbi:MAG TPA: M23 family metallopeptidase [Nocardioides sp.]|jgi:murein DD-endopeptidase MepM/ murein hydrolase activator NlpD|nr:M23 family metallopeptidase [Nocardioides sp.]
MGRQMPTGTLALDLGRSSAVPRLLHRTPGKPKAHDVHRAGASAGRHHGTDTRGGDVSSADRDLALASTWYVDPSLLTPQPGDSSTTRQARTELASVVDRLDVVMDRYDQARAGAQDAAAAAAKSRVELEAARDEAAAAHRVYVRDHQLLVQLITTDYEEPPLTSLDFLLAARDFRDLTVGMGTMQQVGDNQASVVTEAEAATEKMRATAAGARLAADAARRADQKAHDTLAAAADAGRTAIDQLHKARNVLTLSVLADQMQTSLADAMKYADQLKPGSVSFPLPPHSGFYDNHNWGEVSPHWASIHTGDDYSVACGTPVLAATAGTIEILTDQSWAGPWLVMVSTGRGKLTTWYAHMQALAVEPGQHVKPGQIIGQVGQEGNATGCHLHFELHPNGGSIYQDTTDPDPWLKAVGSYPGS